MKKEFNFTWAALNLLGKSLYSNAWAAIDNARDFAHFGLGLR